MDLSAADVELLLATVAEIHEPGTLADLRGRALRAVTALVAADSTTWNEIDLATGARVVQSWPDIPTDHLLDAFNAHLHEHPVIRHHGRTGDGRPWAVSDFVGQADFRASLLYREVFAPLGVEDQMSFVLPDPDILLGIACNGGWAAFGERDRTLLNLTRPHLVQARRDAIAYDRTRWYLETVDDLLERDGEGLLLVDARHRVEYVTPNAAVIVRHWFGVTDLHALPAPLAAWLVPGDGASPGDEPFLVDDDRQRLRARRLPGPDRTTTAILLRESGLHPRDRARLQALGLTPRQAEILHLVAEGLSNAAIALRLHLSQRTVEQHVHAALNKLGATNRTQAARLLREH